MTTGKLWIRRIAAVLTCWLMVMGTYGARAKIEWRTYVQPDGTVLTLTLWGNADFNCYRDGQGRMYSRDSQGVFHLLPAEQTRHQEETVMTRSDFGSLNYAKMDWDPNRTYRQLVVLLSFSDCDFSMDDPQATYDAMFNQSGYNQRNGAGCVADYFRDQSGGQFNLKFDVYGPFKVNAQVKTGSSSRNEGRSSFRSATQALMTAYPDLDFSPYDWDGNGRVEQVIYVYAGYSGNQASIVDQGYTWPTTGSFSSISTPDNHTISNYSASGELWTNNTSCGIGTICHEFSHSLGLPDVYPTSSSVEAMSIVDEWDLMDGGHFTNRGWCPPNYSPLEKMLLGWLTPTELMKDTTIAGLKPIAEGGEAYIVRHTDNEFYLLENRQWKGWDYGLPGRGLVVYHVYYNQGRWQGNTVNNVNGKPYYSLVPADNLDYMGWYNLIMARGGKNPYADTQQRLNSAILGTAAYPWQTDSTDFVNRELTSTSTPATQMYDADDTGSTMLTKSITDITQNDDGTVSFVFHANGESGIKTPEIKAGRYGIYTLTGRKLRADASIEDLPKGIYIINGKKVVRR